MPPKVRSQVRASRDAEFIHPIWWDIGSYAHRHGNKNTVRAYSAEFNIGNGPHQRSELAAAKIVAKYRHHYEAGNRNYNPDGRKKKEVCGSFTWDFYHRLTISL
jgi:hypothetical protein